MDVGRRAHTPPARIARGPRAAAALGITSGRLQLCGGASSSREGRYTARWGRWLDRRCGCRRPTRCGLRGEGRARREAGLTKGTEPVGDPPPRAAGDFGSRRQWRWIAGRGVMTYLTGHIVDADMTELLSDWVVLSLLVSLRCLLLHSALYDSEILVRYTLRLIAAHAPSLISCTVSAGRSPSRTPVALAHPRRPRAATYGRIMFVLRWPCVVACQLGQLHCECSVHARFGWMTPWYATGRVRSNHFREASTPTCLATDISVSSSATIREGGVARHPP